MMLINLPEKGTKLSPEATDFTLTENIFQHSRIAVASNNRRNQNHTQDYRNKFHFTCRKCSKKICSYDVSMLIIDVYIW
jgi:hypothetical protein